MAFFLLLSFFYFFSFVRCWFLRIAFEIYGESCGMERVLRRQIHLWSKRGALQPIGFRRFFGHFYIHYIFVEYNFHSFTTHDCKSINERIFFECWQQFQMENYSRRQYIALGSHFKRMLNDVSRGVWIHWICVLNAGSFFFFRCGCDALPPMKGVFEWRWTYEWFHSKLWHSALYTENIIQTLQLYSFNIPLKFYFCVLNWIEHGALRLEKQKHKHFAQLSVFPIHSSRSSYATLRSK